MHNNKIAYILSNSILFSMTLVYAASTHAAKAIDLSHLPPAALRLNELSMQEVSRSVDFNQTLHVRVQETYQGYPVRGADAILHIPGGSKTATSLTAVAAAANEKKGSMNGMFYQDLQTDLADTPAYVFNQAQAQKALSQAVATYEKTEGHPLTIQHKQTRLLVYIDNHQKAHWAYEVSFYVLPTTSGETPAKPMFIMDAASLHVYKQWNGLKTISEVQGGGFGGNERMGKKRYDGVADHLPSLTMQRDEVSHLCYLQNDRVTVLNRWYDVMSFSCQKPEVEHNNLYWNADFDAYNGAFSPANDALYAGKIVDDMYQGWYGMPALLSSDGKAMRLTMVVHLFFTENAYWDDINMRMMFGDGGYLLHPLTSIGIAAHEISHGFTDQHAKLMYENQASGGVNESFSDMAAQAAEFYAYGKSSWKIGSEILKSKSMTALRFMDEPTNDCEGRAPGDQCSIDHASQYKEGLDPHYSSGLFNRAFYLLSTTPGWGVKKAFGVMIKANHDYWTSDTSFSQAACGVVQAARDYTFNENDVMAAFSKVGIQASC
jgi:pseudolysin